MDLISNSFMSIEQAQDAYLQDAKKVNRQSSVSNQTSFRQILEQVSNRNDTVSFSRHANERLSSRNIRLNEEQMQRLNEGVKQAKEKSIQESLVMMDNIAFIVNVKNNTVITAIDQNTNDSNVFTNIDGAVIV
ncbi:flagellar operon protein [Clostridium sp. CAG:590]|nr:flagellar operon protein [Clostridium sp. CAG:590]